MNISFNWLKEFIDYPFEVEELSGLLTDIGLEVGKVTKYQSIQGGLKGIVVGEIKSCEKHPNADRLSLTTVDVGEDELLSIVCGAPNVQAGQKVLVAKVGTTLFPKNGESFKIKKAKIRGELSQGMICAEDELGLGDSHEGIIILPEETQIGLAAYDLFDIEEDTIFDIDLTPNRSDATSHYGVAKDLLAALRVRRDVEGNLPSYPAQFDVDSEAVSDFKVRVEDSEACPRYAGILLSDIEVKKSPQWIINRLEAIGVRSINNVVDITNYVLHELGQPLHAFDSDKIPSREIVVKCLPQGSNFVSLDEKERSLHSEDLMICDGDGNGLCIGGVFGGLHSGVSDRTVNLFLEAAHFNPRYIRRSATRHLLKTDASKVFEKGSDPDRCAQALIRATNLLIKYAGAKIASPLYDIYTGNNNRAIIDLNLQNLQLLSGHPFTMPQVKEICMALEMNIISSSDQNIVVQIPSDRADVLRQEDLIEEILRIYGYNNTDEKSKIEFSGENRITSEIFGFKERIAGIMAGMGCNEMMGLSMTEASSYESSFASEKKNRVVINNTSNSHLDTMRTNMLISSLEAIRYNHNRNQRNLLLFEIGSTYHKYLDGFNEEELLSMCMTGSQFDNSWLSNGENSSDIYYIKSKINSLLLMIGLDDVKHSVTQGDYFEYGVNLSINNNSIGEYGKIRRTITDEFDISSEVFYGQLKIHELYEISEKRKTQLSSISKYPSISRDLSLSLSDSVTYNQIEEIIIQNGGSLVQKVNLFDVYQDDQLKQQHMKSYSVSIAFTDFNKTLSDKGIDQIMKGIITKLKEELKAELR